MPDHDKHLVPMPKGLVTTVGRQLATTERLLANQFNQPLLVPQFWHPGGVTSIAFSPDSRVIALGGQDHAIRLWDIERGVCLRVLEGQEEYISSVFFSPDGTLIGSVAARQTIRVWDVKSGKLHQEVRSNSKCIYAATFMPSTRLAALVEERGSLGLWDVGNNDHVEINLKTPSFDNLLVFSPNGRMTLSIGGTTFCLGETESGKILLKSDANLDWALSVALSPDGRVIALGRADGEIHLWNTSKGECQRVLTTPAGDFINSVAFSHDGRLVASGEDCRVRLWDVETGDCLLALGYSAEIHSVGFTPNNQLIALGSWNKNVCFREAESGRTARVSEYDLPQFTDAVFSPGGELVAKGMSDGTIRLWETSSGNCSKVLPAPTSLVGSVIFSPDGRKIASGADDGTIHLWDIETGQEQQALNDYSGRVWPAAFSPDGQFLVSMGGEDGTVRLWAVDTAECLLMLDDQTEVITCVCFSPDGRSLATGTDEGVIRLWAVTDRELLEKMEVETGDFYVEKVLFSTDGRTIIAIGDGATYFVDLENCKCSRKLKGPSWLETPIAFSHHDKMLAIGGGDGKISLLETSTGKCKAEIYYFPENSWAVVASDGRYDSSDFGETPWLRWTVAMKTYPVTKFKDRYYTPGLLSQVLSGSVAMNEAGAGKR